MLLQNVRASHCRAIKIGHLSDTYAANNILLRYARIDLHNACKLFDEIPHKDIVTWNTVVSNLVNFGHLQTAFTFHKSMFFSGILPDSRTFASLLKGVAFSAIIDAAQQMHSLSITSGHGDDVYVGSALVDAYAKCRNLTDSLKVFRSMRRRTSVTWNALISGCVKLEDYGMSFSLFNAMEKEGVSPDDGTLSPLLSLLGDSVFLPAVSQLHSKILKIGLECECVVCNALITSYSECGSLLEARKVFDGFPLARDLVSFNSLIAAYLTHDEIESAIDVFLGLEGAQPDVITFTSVISACSGEKYRVLGENLHGLVMKNGCLSSLHICNALTGMYVGVSMEKALKMFNSIEKKERVSCNTVLTGYSQNNLHEEAIDFFREMRYSRVEVDHYALSASLRSCSNVATLQLGQAFHGLAKKLGLETNEYVASSLIFMYYKTGAIESAEKSFKESPDQTTIMWNSIIFAYAQHGEGNRALEFFYKMRERKVRIDHITFVAALTACSHVGLIKEGKSIFTSMERLGISPRKEHYICMVDMYGRAGLLEEAKRLIEMMPFKADAMVWKAMLGACRRCGDLEYGKEVGEMVMEMEPGDHCAYVMLWSMYGRAGRWEEKAVIANKMREKSVRKIPGCSWIEFGNRIKVFRAEEGFEIDDEILKVCKGVFEETNRFYCILEVQNE